MEGNHALSEREPNLYRLAQRVTLSRMFREREKRDPATNLELIKWAWHHQLTQSRLKPSDDDLLVVMIEQESGGR